MISLTQAAARLDRIEAGTIPGSAYTVADWLSMQAGGPDVTGKLSENERARRAVVWCQVRETIADFEAEKTEMAEYS